MSDAKYDRELRLLERRAEAAERQADAAERRNELLEDQNALLWALTRELHYRLSTREELESEPAHASKPPIEDGLFTLGYTRIGIGGREHGRPEEVDR